MTERNVEKEVLFGFSALLLLVVIFNGLGPALISFFIGICIAAILEIMLYIFRKIDDFFEGDRKEFETSIKKGLDLFFTIGLSLLSIVIGLCVVVYLFPVWVSWPYFGGFLFFLTIDVFKKKE